MSDHVSVRVVQSDVVVLSALDCLNNLVGDFSAFHPRTLLERNNIAWNFNIVLKLFVELALLVSVEEVCNVSVLLGLGNSHEVNACLCEVFAHCAVNARRIHKILGRNVRVSVVFHHTGILNGRNTLSVKRKLASCRCLKRACHLKGTVSAEVEVDYAVAVVDCSDWLSVLCDYELVHILVKNARNFGTVGFDCLCRRVEHTSFAQNVRLPSALNHAPVSVVAVHCHVHTSAAGGNLIVAACKARKEFFKRCDVVQCGSRVNVASVKQCVHADFLYSFLVRLFNHRLEVVDVGVNVSVRYKSYKVKG